MKIPTCATTTRFSARSFKLTAGGADVYHAGDVVGVVSLTTATSGVAVGGSLVFDTNTETFEIEASIEYDNDNKVKKKNDTRVLRKLTSSALLKLE